MKTITSRANPEIKLVAALHQAKYRTQHKKFIAEGTRVCSALLNAGHRPEALYVTQAMENAGQKLVGDKQLVLVSDHVMEKISAATTPSGMLGLFLIPEPPAPEQLSSGIVLACIADPGNMGTLIRSAAAMNTQSIVIIEGVDPWSPKVIQATAGTIGQMTIFNWTWRELLAHKKKLKLYALVISGGKKPQELSFNNTLLVIGSEARGIPADWLADCDATITLPMPGNIESLNAAVAGSIALYLAYTQ